MRCLSHRPSSASTADKLHALINGYRVTQTVSVAASLGIPAVLADEARDCEQLAQSTRTHAASLLRLLRALVAIGILAIDAKDRFALTELGRGLVPGHPGSCDAWAQFVATPAVWAAWGNLIHTIRSGENAFRHVHGLDTWAYRAAHPGEAQIFDAAMRENTARIVEPLLECYDFSAVQHMIDVGGGDGALLSGLLARCSRARGTLFDLPHVIASAKTALGANENRLLAVPGSFFDSVPFGGDVYFLKHVLHDWQDAEATAILRNCRTAMTGRSRLLVLERVVEPLVADQEAALADLNMLVNAGGRERSLQEFRALLASAGLAIATQTPLLRGTSLIEVVPAI